MYFERCGYSIDVVMLFGCVIFRHGANCSARCWYLGCSLIVQCIKYVLFLLCVMVGVC